MTCLSRFAASLALVACLLLLPIATLAATPAAGPPFPAPQSDVTVYDYANLFSPATEARATQIIADIEHRTGAEVAVYTQYKPDSDEASTESDAKALLDQWGVGRPGFYDGLAVLVNMNRTQCLPGVSGNGQVQLYAGDGFKAAFMSDQERQNLFDNDMKPLLAQCDFDGALNVAMDAIDANATPEHASKLASARIIDAAIGLIGAPLILILLVGWASWSWLRYGRDPVYLDDASVLMPAPPPGLTAASAAVVWEGRASRRALTTAMMDLASRGEMSFVPESTTLGLHTKTGIQMGVPDTANPYVARNRRRPLSGAENYALDRLQSIAGAETGHITPTELLKFGPYTAKFDEQIEAHVAQSGWFTEPPAKSTSRWSGRGTLAIVGGVIAFIIGFNLPSQGVTLLGAALVAAGVLIIMIARAMPARTMAGAMIYAQLAAYQRTLEKTMAQARSMNQVVEGAGLSWIETPDQATVWGVALGLQSEVEAVIERSAEDVSQGVSTYNPWMPMWYGNSFASSGGSGGGGGMAPGLFSGSALPDFGGMMSTLGSIGNSPSSSGSGSGGFSGGGSGGGGGGGAGGGF